MRIPDKTNVTLREIVTFFFVAIPDMFFFLVCSLETTLAGDATLRR